MPLVERFALRKIFVQDVEPTNEWLDGDVWVDSNNGVLSVNVSGTATSVGLTFARVVKSVDQTLANDTTLQNDDELTFNINANKNYQGMLIFYNTCPNAANFKIAFTVPSGATMDGLDYGQLSGGNAISILDLTSAQVIDSNTDPRVIIYNFKINNGSTAGAVTLQWAQNVIDVGINTVLMASSIIVYEDI